MQVEKLIAKLPDYLKGQLPRHEQQLMEEQLEKSEELREALNSLKLITEMESEWQDEPVPEWHRTAFAARARKQEPVWTQWLSMGASFAAVLLVVFQVKITSNTDGWQVSFGAQEPEANMQLVQQEVNRILDDWSAEQTAFVNHRLLEFENQQLRNQQQLLAATFEVNREQRQQELMQVTQILMQKRTEDQLKTRHQYRELLNQQSEQNQVINTLLTNYRPEQNDSE